MIQSYQYLKTKADGKNSLFEMKIVFFAPGFYEFVQLG